MKRIGLTQRVEVAAETGERRDALDQAWAPLVTGMGFVPVPLPNRTSNISAAIDNLQLGGIIMTGGNDLGHLPHAHNTAPERDELEHHLLDLCAERGIPVLGVCRGLQMIACHYGGELSPLHGHVATLRDQ